MLIILFRATGVAWHYSLALRGALCGEPLQQPRTVEAPSACHAPTRVGLVAAACFVPRGLGSEVAAASARCSCSVAPVQGAAPTCSPLERCLAPGWDEPVEGMGLPLGVPLAVNGVGGARGPHCIAVSCSCRNSTTNFLAAAVHSAAVTGRPLRARQRLRGRHAWLGLRVHRASCWRAYTACSSPTVTRPTFHASPSSSSRVAASSSRAWRSVNPEHASSSPPPPGKDSQIGRSALPRYLGSF